MKLYYTPFACSLADHIALSEAGATFELERVDLKTKRTASGADFKEITLKGYVPVLKLDSGEILTENIAILDWLSAQFPALGVPGSLGRTRVLEALAFVSTELHASFKPMWHGGSEAQTAQASTKITGLLNQIADSFADNYIFGPAPSVADFYLFVMLLWAERFDVAIPASLLALREEMERRPAVEAAMRREGLIPMGNQRPRVA